MENYEIRKRFEDFSNRLAELNKAIDIDKLKEEIQEIEKEIANPTFYEDRLNSSKVLKKLKKDKDDLEAFQVLVTNVDELNCYYEMQKNNEATEEELDSDITSLISLIETNLTHLEEKMLLNGPYDDCDCLFELHPGAGGTESMDWALMLFRMYKRYCEKNDYEFELIDYLPGEEAGIKSVSFIVKGDKAYGYLKSEHGVHRLVRISPFDSNAKRHTSFCSVNITPVITENINIDITPDQIRVDVFRSSGAGGQSVNTTDSAVRITHLKTGIVVTCQNERSQIQNREIALEILKSKLYKLEKDKQDLELKKINGESSVNGFSSQIRSYVFHPYSMVKDLRTNYEVGNASAVMDGDLFGFINAYLKFNGGE